MTKFDDVASALISHNNDDPKQLYRGRFQSFAFAIKIDEQGYLIKIVKGRVESVVPLEKATEPPAFTFSATSKDWDVFSQKFPPPGYQDVMAMVECGHAKLTGDVFRVLVNLFFVKGVVNGIRMRRAA